MMMTANSLSELQFENFANWSNCDSLIAYLIVCYSHSPDPPYPSCFCQSALWQPRESLLAPQVVNSGRIGSGLGILFYFHLIRTLGQLSEGEFRDLLDSYKCFLHQANDCQEETFLVLFIIGWMLIKALSRRVLSSLSSFLTPGGVMLCIFSTSWCSAH